MKKQIPFLLGLFVIPLVVFAQTNCNFYDDFSSTLGWTQIGTNVSVSNGKVVFQNGAAGSVQRRVHRPIGHSLNEDYTWSAEVDFHPTSVGQYGGQPFAGHFLLALTAGSQDFLYDCPNIPCSGYPTGSQDGFIVYYAASLPPTGNLYFEIYSKDSLARYVSSSRIYANDLDTTYYLRLEHLTDTVIRLSVFWDSARTTPLPGSPIYDTIPATITGLTTLQHGTQTGGDSRRQLNGWIDDVCLNWQKSATVGLASPEKKQAFNLYPNPAFEFLHIEYNDILPASIQVFDYTGKLVMAIRMSSNRERISIAELPSGVYFATLQAGNRRRAVRFVKKK